MLDMAKKKIIPSCISYTKEICDAAIAKNSIGVSSSVEKAMAEKLSALTEGIVKETAVLDEKVIAAQGKAEGLEMAKFYREEVFAQMQTLRALVDETEMNVSEDAWPFPSYSKLLFTV